MSEVKFIEILDRMTFIPAVAVLLAPHEPREALLMHRAGYGPASPNTVLMARLVDGRGHVDPFEWCDRTHTSAHRFIAANWNVIQSGDVVDVEYILGETTEPKKSEVAL